jgi:hypothetical protein
MHLKQGMLFQNPKKEQISKVNKSFRGINGVSWGFNKYKDTNAVFVADQLYRKMYAAD